VPSTTLLDMPQEEQDQMLATLRRSRYGYLLALHVLCCVQSAALRRRLPACCSARAQCLPYCPSLSRWEAGL